jgi:hypothetical protein
MCAWILRNEDISFVMNNLVYKSIEQWAYESKIWFDTELRENILKFENFLNSFPQDTNADLYTDDPELNYSYKGVYYQGTYPGGDAAFIRNYRPIAIQVYELLKNSLSSDNNGEDLHSKLKPFKKFGTWHYARVPQYFIPKPGILTVLSFNFDIDLYPKFKKKVYAHKFVVHFLRKSSTEFFSENKVRSLSRESRDKDLNKIFSKHNIDGDEIEKFFKYMIKYYRKTLEKGCI